MSMSQNFYRAMEENMNPYFPSERLYTRRKKKDIPVSVNNNHNLTVEKPPKIATKKLTAETEWLDYVSLNKAIELKRKKAAMRLLNSNCRVNLPSALDLPSNTPLHNAIVLGDINLVDCLLNKGASFIAVNPQGDSPLHLAFLRRQDQLVDLILSFIEKHSNYVNPKNSQGLTHLHIASTRENAALVMNFLQAGADIQDSVNADSPLWPNYTALHFAIEFGSIQSSQVLQKVMKETKKDHNCNAAVQLAYKKVKDLSIMVHILSAENHFLNFGFFTYPSYFHFACMRNDPKVVAEFIKNGADVNTPLSREALFCALYSPLHFAVESNCIENVKLLLENGAIVEHRNVDNMTALHLAMYNEISDKQKYTIVDILYAALEDKEVYLKDNYGLSYLHIACTRNDTELVQKFLDNHHDVNAKIYDNPRKFSQYTPLHFAVRYRSFDVVKLLIERGADVNAIDSKESGTPLHLACEVGHAGIIDLLLKYGATANIIRDKGNKTTLHLLVESYMDRENGGSIDNKLALLPLVKKLVKLGVNVNAKDKYGCTALHMACWTLVDGSQCVKKLLEVGADINQENFDGQTPLEMTYFESYCGNAEDYMMLYHHVQKLKALGLKVNPKNVGYCEVIIREKNIWDPEHKDFKDKKIAKKDEQRQDELLRLRNTQIPNSNWTLHDILVCELRRLKVFARDQIVKEIVEDKGLKKEFPAFAHFLKIRYEKAMKQFESQPKKEGRQGRNFKAGGKPKQHKRPRFR